MKRQRQLRKEIEKLGDQSTKRLELWPQKTDLESGKVMYCAQDLINSPTLPSQLRFTKEKEIVYLPNLP